ncbi:MAG: sigma factor [Panacibacter sp.]
MLRNVQSAEDDQQIIALLRQGNKQSLGVLYDKYAAALFGIICRITDNKHLAEEILNKVFVKAWQQISGFNASNASLCSWLINIARQTAFDAVKQEPLINSSNRNTVYRSLKDGNKEHSAFDLVFYGGMTLAESAATLGIPVEDSIAQIRMTIQRKQEKNEIA